VHVKEGGAAFHLEDDLHITLTASELLSLRFNATPSIDFTIKESSNFVGETKFIP
jgi:hypothetical protein